MSEPRFRRIEGGNGYGFILDRAEPESHDVIIDFGDLGEEEPRTIDDVCRDVIDTILESKPEEKLHPMLAMVVKRNRCAECQLLDCACPNQSEMTDHERLVVAASQLARANQRIRELEEEQNRLLKHTDGLRYHLREADKAAEEHRQQLRDKQNAVTAVSATLLQERDRVGRINECRRKDRDLILDLQRQLEVMTECRGWCQQSPDDPERWYWDVAAEYMREVEHQPESDRCKRLARLLKHMAGR